MAERTAGGSILILRSGEVAELLEGRERQVIETVRAAYVAHGNGRSSLPHSSFLRFPGDERNRIIALPAFLGDGFDLAGVKWISSFPENVARGTPRASAVVVLNSSHTGRPEAVLEGSIISARRTAASAALAATVLTVGCSAKEAGLIGSGLINFEVARFLRVALPEVRHFVLHDLNMERAGRLAGRLRGELDGVSAELAPELAAVLERCRLISFATTATEPHVGDLSTVRPGTTVLHVSLRDLAPEVILSQRTDNVVDDPDHVCRAQTSVHLAEQAVGSRNFIRCTLAQVLEGLEPPRRDSESVSVFSPFGLGILDLAVAQLVVSRAQQLGRGTRIESFLPTDETPGRRQ